MFQRNWVYLKSEKFNGPYKKCKSNLSLKFNWLMFQRDEYIYKFQAANNEKAKYDEGMKHKR